MRLNLRTVLIFLVFVGLILTQLVDPSIYQFKSVNLSASASANQAKHNGTNFGQANRARQKQRPHRRPGRFADATDFKLTIPVTEQTVKAGEVASFVVIATGINGFNAPIDLTESITPVDMTIDSFFNNDSVVPGGGATLMILTSDDTPAGTFTITITGMVGDQKQDVTATLKINGGAASIKPEITKATYSKSVLMITGSKFTTANAVVRVNNFNVSTAITKQTDTEITLKGKKKQLRIKKGDNSVSVMVNGVTSDTFKFKF